MDPGELVSGPASALNCDHERHRLSFRFLIQAHDLRKAVVLDHKIFSFESINQPAITAFHQRGYQNQVGLTAEGRLLPSHACHEEEQKKKRVCRSGA